MPAVPIGQQPVGDSPKSLYDAELASFAMDGYDITAARGFIDLLGLPMQVRGAKQGVPKK